jgi:hypothetical protein
MSKPPITTISTSSGASHSFFRTRKKLQSSLTNSFMVQNCCLKELGSSAGVWRSTQYDGTERRFRRNSSRPNKRAMIDMGVISAKNMTPNTIGLTILPSNSPNANQALLRDVSNCGATAATRKKAAPAREQRPETIGFHGAKTPYMPTEMRIAANVNPNFRLEGSAVGGSVCIDQFRDGNERAVRTPARTYPLAISSAEWIGCRWNNLGGVEGNSEEQMLLRR